MKPLVLMVDDDVDVLSASGKRFTDERPDLDFEGCADAEKALLRIRNRPPWVLVAGEQRMPTLSGLELLLLAREQVPSLPVVVVSSQGSNEMRQELTRHRALEYLAKPFEFPSLLAAIERATCGSEGFTGNVSLPTLADLIQMYALAHTTGTLSVSHSGEVGEIWFVDGEVVHATCAGREGGEAIYELVKWPGGSVSSSPGKRSKARSIDQSWQQMLLEAFCRLDESRDGAEGTPEAPAESRKGKARAERKNGTPNAAAHRPPTGTSTLDVSLSRLTQIEGFLGACLVDSNTGLTLGVEGSGPIDLEIAAAGSTEVMRAERKTILSLGFKDQVEDMLITLSNQYHLLRPATHVDGLFFYLVLDKRRANLALARRSLAEVEGGLAL